jgi:hypothetical protein
VIWSRSVRRSGRTRSSRAGSRRSCRHELGRRWAGRFDRSGCLAATGQKGQGEGRRDRPATKSQTYHPNAHPELDRPPEVAPSLVAPSLVNSRRPAPVSTTATRLSYGRRLIHELDQLERHAFAQIVVERWVLRGCHQGTDGVRAYADVERALAKSSVWHTHQASSPSPTSASVGQLSGLVVIGLSA